MNFHTKWDEFLRSLNDSRRAIRFDLLFSTVVGY